MTHQDMVDSHLQTPRRPGDQFDEDSFADLGVLEAKLDPDSAFALRHQIRTEARKQFVKIDCGRRCARAIVRKSAPLPGNYSVGDLINFQIKVVDRDDSRAESEAYRWSSTARIV